MRLVPRGDRASGAPASGSPHTQWSCRPQISCKPCAVKRQVQDAAFCLCLGWWGLPWGLVFTPLQLWRNVSALVAGPNPLTPSPLLDRVMRLHLAQHLTIGNNIGGDKGSRVAVKIGVRADSARTSASENPNSPPVSANWRCSASGHEWVDRTLEWNRPCPSCGSAAVDRVVVTADGRFR